MHICTYIHISCIDIWLPHPSDITPPLASPSSTTAKGDVGASIRSNVCGAWSGCNCIVACDHIILGNRSGAMYQPRSLRKNHRPSQSRTVSVLRAGRHGLSYGIFQGGLSCERGVGLGKEPDKGLNHNHNYIKCVTSPHVTIGDQRSPERSAIARNIQRTYRRNERQSQV